MLKYVKPPASPPTLAFEERVLPVVAFEWVGENGLETYRAAERQEDALIPSIEYSKGENLILVLSASRRPDQLSIVAFEDLDTSGVPKTEGVEIDCLQDERCVLVANTDEDILTISTIPPAHAMLIVVHLGYFDVDVSESGHPVLQSATWGIRLKSL